MRMQPSRYAASSASPGTRRAAAGLAAALLVGGVGLGGYALATSDDTPDGTSVVAGSASPSGPASSTPPVSPTPPASSPLVTTPAPSGTGTPGAVASTRHTGSSNGPTLVGDRRNMWVFAPLADPERVTVEGSVGSTKAWSTSKVLVVTAYVATVAGGDPARLSASAREQVAAALGRSDMSALLSLQRALPESPSRPIGRILRSIGDKTTVPRDSSIGGMLWSPREQVRFLGALAAGRVVNAATSRYVLSAMRPVAAHAWGLGTIGARAYKGGWLRADTVTRQMGIVDGYAVAILTDAVGPAVVQSDGDSAHVEQMNHLAALLARRLAAERARLAVGR